jgi:gamma-glutamylcyclotransferase (GGCT)/AIG2-like uncharacterized protein YtfP
VNDYEQACSRCDGLGWRAPDNTNGCRVCWGTGSVQLVFVYGMLMPEARRPAQLNDYRLEFAYYATVMPSPGSMVLGGVAEVPNVRLASMDRQEGVADGYYRRERVTLVDETEAWVYVQDRPALERPSASYFADMARQYVRLGHDEGPLADALVRVGGLAREEAVR